MKLRRVILKFAEPLIVFTIWLLVFVAPIFIFQNNDQVVWKHVSRSWLGVLPFLLLFLVNHFLLTPFLFFKNKKTLYFIAAFSLVLAFAFSSYLSNKSNRDPRPKHQPGMHQPPPPQFENQRLPGRPLAQDQRNRNPIAFPPYANTFIIAVLVIGFDTGLRMIFRWSKLEKEKTILEKENVQNQLAFLQTQISPHFFMNTLNNIHALIDVDTEEARDAIIKLSKLMRHLLYDSQAETTTLQKEVDFIKSYINLMKLRFFEKVAVNLDFPAIIPDKSIPPLLFTSLIENAFKHGISYSQPSFIRIMMSFSDNSLTFETKNSRFNRDTAAEESGIGIENTRRRLNLLYHENYSLHFDETENEFTAKLTIPL